MLLPYLRRNDVKRGRSVGEGEHFKRTIKNIKEILGRNMCRTTSGEEEKSGGGAMMMDWTFLSPETPLSAGSWQLGYHVGDRFRLEGGALATIRKMEKRLFDEDKTLRTFRRWGAIFFFF